MILPLNLSLLEIIQEESSKEDDKAVTSTNQQDGPWTSLMPPPGPRSQKQDGCSNIFHKNLCRVQKEKQENIFAIPFNSHYHFIDYQQGFNFKLSLKIVSPNLYSFNFSMQCMNEQGTQNHNFTGFQFSVAIMIFTHPTHPLNFIN